MATATGYGRCKSCKRLRALIGRTHWCQHCYFLLKPRDPVDVLLKPDERLAEFSARAEKRLPLFAKGGK